MNKKLFTYKKSGVDISASDKFVTFISKISAKKRGKKKFDNIGSFGSISDIPKNVRNPKIVACTDGVGTKIEIANMIHKYNTIGIDLVAMSVNDLIVQGAKPLLFLDYISINKIDLPKLKSIVKGIFKGCKLFSSLAQKDQQNVKSFKRRGNIRTRKEIYPFSYFYAFHE